MTMRRFWLPLLLALLALHGSAAADRATPSGISAHDKGINAGELYALADDKLAARVAEYQDAGVRWVRLGFEWNVIQPSAADRFEWARYDAVVKALSGAGMRILGLIAYTPPWANGGYDSKYYPPQSSVAFARFASQVAQRYCADQVAAWEIWNEPNLGNFWRPAADARAYGALLKATSSAIRRVAPRALILSGGLAQPYESVKDQDARDFLRQLYSDGAGPYIDGVANHPYTTPYLASSLRGHNWKKMSIYSPSMRDIMLIHGDGAKPIWITEFGAPTAGMSGFDIKVDEATQALMLTDIYGLARRESWLGPVFWYNFQDFCPPQPEKSTECYYGLVRFDGSRKPAYLAYRYLSSSQ